MDERDLELLSQYMDGELSVEAAQDLRQRLIAEPQLRASLERMQKADQSVKQAFIGTDAVPAGIAAMLAPAGSGHTRTGWFRGAIAASLVVAAALVVPDWQQGREKTRIFQQNHFLHDFIPVLGGQGVVAFMLCLYRSEKDYRRNENAKVLHGIALW